ncbi:MAG: hypothetical protein JWN15_665 [Firmicutes bacterium]|nr:hypothetical protein [Bacillota bacterium]
MLGERLRALRDRTRLRRSDLAALFDLTENGYDQYERKENAGVPPLTRAAWAASRMLVSLDWLIGNSATMWAQDILMPMRITLRTEIDRRPLGPSVDFDHRICELLRWTHQYDPERYDAFVLAAVAPLARSREKCLEKMEAILQGEDIEIVNPAIDYLAGFWQLSPTWLMHGTGEPFITDPGPHLATLQFLQEHGLSYEFLAHHLNVLTALKAGWTADQQEAGE